jgi:hypothetical protein
LARQPTSPFTHIAAIRTPTFIFHLISLRKTHFMARPRIPLIKAQTTGRTLRNPRRFKDRKEPPSPGELGSPPKWFKTDSQKEAWKTFADELPWLNKSHRALVGIACEIRGRQIAGEEVVVKGMNLLRMILGSMGATPSDSSKVKMPDQQEDEDPSKKYFT